MLTAKTVRRFNVVPRIALLSYSNFGSSLNSNVFKITEALKIINSADKEIMLDTINELEKISLWHAISI